MREAALTVGHGAVRMSARALRGVVVVGVGSGLEIAELGGDRVVLVGRGRSVVVARGRLSVRVTGRVVVAVGRMLVVIAGAWLVVTTRSVLVMAEGGVLVVPERGVRLMVPRGVLGRLVMTSPLVLVGRGVPVTMAARLRVVVPMMVRRCGGERLVLVLLQGAVMVVAQALVERDVQPRPDLHAEQPD